jgi:hypothetical protein
MPIICGIDVHESKRRVILQKLESLDLPGNDLAENAVGIGFHLSLPVRNKIAIALSLSSSP